MVVRYCQRYMVKMLENRPHKYFRGHLLGVANTVLATIIKHRRIQFRHQFTHVA
jgi:hypothetical protein